MSDQQKSRGLEATSIGGQLFAHDFSKTACTGLRVVLAAYATRYWNKPLSVPKVLWAGNVLGASWAYTNGEFLAKYGAGGEVFGLAFGALIAPFIALSCAELASKGPGAGREVAFAHLASNRT